MSQASPLTIGSELLAAIEQFGLNDEPPSQFELARLKREATKLLKVNAREAYVVLAGTAALEWDATAVIENSSKALNLGKNAATYMNCALSLRFVGEVSRSADLMTEAVQHHPLDMDILKAAVDVLASGGRLREAAQLCGGVVERSTPSFEFFEASIGLSAKADKLGISNETLVSQADLAFQVLAKHHRRIREYSLRTVPDPDGTEVLVSSIHFVGTARDELRMESELALLLADLPDWNPCVFAMELKAISPEYAHSTV